MSLMGAAVKNLLTMVLLILPVLSTAWAQGPRPSSLADLAKYTGADRERILYEGAKKEGKLTWYASLAPHKEIAKVFSSKYPGVAVDIYRADGVVIANRILTEAQAKRHIVDAIEITPPALMLLRDSQLLLPYASPHLANYPANAVERTPAGLALWTTDRESLIGVGYNKNLMAAADLPKKYDDLLKPALKGKMSVATNETGARAIGAMLKAKGEAFVRKLRDQEIRPHAIPAGALANLIISGEVPISFTQIQTNLTQPAGTKEAPVAWIPMEVVAVNAGGAAVYAHAPRPHAALLFVDFLISPEGQKMYAEKLFYGSATKAYGFERWYPEKGLTTAEYEENADRWLKILREISRK
jgi:iron(III) transport system substrate-binding protein